MENKKPYEFRGLCATDIPLMTNVIKAIGINEFKNCFTKDVIENIISMFKKDKPTEEVEEKVETDLTAVGIAMLPTALELVEIVLSNYDRCQTSIIKLLAKTSNLSEKEVEKLSLVDFTEMVFDFIKKDEFPDFFKVVSRLFKSTN